MPADRGEQLRFLGRSPNLRGSGLKILPQRGKGLKAFSGDSVLGRERSETA